MHSRGTKLLQGVLHCMLLFKGVCEGLKCCFCRVKAEGGGKGDAADSTQSPTAAWQALMAAQCPGGARVAPVGAAPVRAGQRDRRGARPGAAARGTLRALRRLDRAEARGRADGEALLG